MRKIILIAICTLCLSALATQDSHAWTTDYDLALSAVKSGDEESAFLHLLYIAMFDVKNPHRENAMFASGEYYFSLKDYHNAFAVLTQFIGDYPDSKIRPLALFCLLKITREYGNDGLAKEIENKIINLKQVILVFSNSKEYNYTSPLGTNYKLIYHIDKVECYVNEKLLAGFPY